MKRRNEIGLAAASAAAATVCVCVCALPALAQAPADKAKAAPRPTAAPVAGGPGSLAGVWMNAAFKDYRTGPPVGREPNFRTADGQPIPMQPWAAAIVAQRRSGVQNGAPFANNSSKCLTDGMPAATSTPAELPLQIVETPGQVTVLYEYFTTFRIIHMNVRHPDDPDPTFMGNAVGHWEGDTLVVDTIAVTDKTNIMGVIPHTENLHIVERLRRTGPDTMEDRVTIDDPKTFTKPWSMVSHFKRGAGVQLREYVCDNNRNPPNANGQTGVKLQAN